MEVQCKLTARRRPTEVLRDPITWLVSMIVTNVIGALLLFLYMPISIVLGFVFAAAAMLATSIWLSRADDRKEPVDAHEMGT